NLQVAWLFHLMRIGDEIGSLLARAHRAKGEYQQRKNADWPQNKLPDVYFGWPLLRSAISGVRAGLFCASRPEIDIEIEFHFHLEIEIEIHFQLDVKPK